MKFPVVVIGGGHAGVEACAAVARLGLPVALISFRLDGIGQMSCNPAIGGLGKGQIVKEVDALGGVMGRAIDQAGIQFRQLNTSKGPATRSSRAQADRQLYKEVVQALLHRYPQITFIEGEVANLLVQAEQIKGVVLADQTSIEAEQVILTTGTFLRGLMHTGRDQTSGGRTGEKASNGLSQSLESLGFKLGRLKTGTPPRIKLSTIDFSELEEQKGDEHPIPFSLINDQIPQKQISCWITETNPEVHDLIIASKDLSPMFNGQIKSGGPRYCPSIEDKVFRFADKEKHNVFLEPEGYQSDVVYPNGISTSLPLEIQESFIRKIKGLQNAEILQAGYAVEYDFCDPRDLQPTLESKIINGLFLAGQINGTSGYEEAAGQGIVAGINAAMKYQGRRPVILARQDAYIGVMIDDLITNGVDEPYRMFTSRAEYRLLLREDNAALRLAPISRELGLLETDYLNKFNLFERNYFNILTEVNSDKISPDEWQDKKLSLTNPAEQQDLKEKTTLAELLKRPEVRIQHLIKPGIFAQLPFSLLTAIETSVKFAGYIRRQEQEVKQLQKTDAVKIPSKINYNNINGLRNEFVQKLNRVRPYSLAQAQRIPGMTPSAISLISMEIKNMHRNTEKR